VDNLSEGDPYAEDEVSESRDILNLREAICKGPAELVEQCLTQLKSKGKTPQCLHSTYHGSGTSCVHLAISRNQVDILKILFEYGAEPNVEDASSDTPLHYACDNIADTSEVVATLLDRRADIKHADQKKRTPLHLASRKGNVKVVELLLERGAEVDRDDETHNTPLHLAAENGHVRVVQLLLNKLKDQVQDVAAVMTVGRENKEEESPLHLACRNGHLDVAELLLKFGANVNERDNTKATPMHEAASAGFKDMVVLLIKHQANINAENQWNKRPLDVACEHGQSNVVHTLLSCGAKVGSCTMEDAINSGNKNCILAIIESSQRYTAMRQKYQIPGSQEYTTPFRELIKKFPDVAEKFLDLCTTAENSKQNKILLSPTVNTSQIQYIDFNYEFVEDIVDTRSKRSNKRGLQHPEHGEDDTDGRDEIEKEHLGDQDMKSQSTDTLDDIDTGESWGPTDYNKSNHPLSIMVECGCLDLLKHPLIGSLLHYKWKIFGLCYFLNLLWYISFLAFLTMFALLVPSPLEPTCMSVTTGTCNRNNSDPASGLGQGESCSCSLIMSDQHRGFIFALAIVVIVLSISRLAFEIVQFCLLMLNYVKDWVNWIEVAVYICSMMFAWIVHTECLCLFEWQWHFGVAAVFLAWITLLTFAQKFPHTGIYVLMFLSICWTFLKAVILFALLVLAFSLAFYMIFFEPQYQRSPFSSPGRAILKGMTMTTGDFDFDSLFRLSPNGEKEGVDDISFPAITVILWMIFIILMPILLTNMLVGLAVDDIQGIQEAATLEKLKLQVNLVLSVEELLPNFVRLHFTHTERRVPLMKASKKSRSSRFWRRVQYFLWGGEYYDTEDTIIKIRERMVSYKQLQLTQTAIERVQLTSTYKELVSTETRKVSLKSEL